MKEDKKGVGEGESVCVCVREWREREKERLSLPLFSSSGDCKIAVIAGSRWRLKIDLLRPDLSGFWSDGHCCRLKILHPLTSLLLCLIMKNKGLH